MATGGSIKNMPSRQIYIDVNPAKNAAVRIVLIQPLRSHLSAVAPTADKFGRSWFVR
jgi:hypothetical protein